MPGIYPNWWTGLVSAISADLVQRLSDQNLPPLTVEIDGSPGAIQIGPQFVAEQSSPPRVLMIPRDGTFENSRDVVSPTGSAHSNLTWNPRAIGLQWKMFEVQCWGCNFSNQTTPAPDPALDYDAAQALCVLFWQSVHAVAAGEWRTTQYKVEPGAPYLVRVGRVFAFDLAISTPAPDATLGYAARTVKAKVSPTIQINGAPPEPP